MPSCRPPSPPPAGDRRVGSVGIVAAAALLSLATLLPEVLVPPMPRAPDAVGGRTPAPGAISAAVPEGRVEAGDTGDVALDDGPEADRHG